MRATFRLWNPKAAAWARVEVAPLTGYVGLQHHRVEVTKEDATHTGWQIDGHARGSIFLYEPEEPDWLKISASDDTYPLRAGWGLTLYLGSALAAGCLGFKGIYSFTDSRSDYAEMLWNAMRIHGLTKEIRHHSHWVEVLTAEKVRDLYHGRPGVILRCP